MRRIVLSLAVLALPVLTIADQRVEAPRKQARVAPTISQERLDQIRGALVAQIAVYDQAEAAPRAPTPEEAQALARTASAASVAVALPGGGQALPFDGVQMSFAVATRGDDGAVRITHSTGSGVPLAPTGGRHAR